MIPKSVYNKLNKADKAKVKRSLLRGPGSGAYTFDRSNPFGHYTEKIAKYMGAGPTGRKIAAYGGHAIGKYFGVGAYSRSNGKYIPPYRGAHKVIKKMGGSGAYDMPAPSSIVTSATSPPSFGSNRTIIRHREFIGTVNSSIGFDVTKYNVNPGDDITFPWLSGIASNYEKYRPIGVVFEFKSTSGNALNSTNTALGQVLMAPRYNAVDQSTPGSMMEMLQIENCVSFCPAESGACGIECARNYNPLGVLYNRTSVGPTVGSEQLYDFCNFYIATQGMQAGGVVVGQLWVTYEIELLTPVLNSGQVGNTINYFQGIGTAGINTSQYFGTDFTMQDSSTMEMTSTANTVVFPENIVEGQYVMQFIWFGSSQSHTSPTMVTTGCDLVSLWPGAAGTPGLNTYPENATFTSSVMTKTICVNITSGGAYVTLSSGTLVLTPTCFNLQVWQIPDDA